MKTLALAALISLLIMQPITAADRIQQYQVVITLKVEDPLALCKHAWDALLSPDYGLSVAERLLLDEHGSWRVPGCIAAAYQLEKFGGSVQSIGLDIKSMEQ